MNANFFKQECLDRVRAYRAKAASCKAEGLQLSRRMYVKMALADRANARRWAAIK